MNQDNRKFAFVRKIEKAAPVKAVRNGLVNIIPVLIIGAFALILETFPVTWYQNLIADSFFLKLLDIINKATFGVLSVYMTFSISRSYMKLKADRDSVSGGAIIASLIAFFILSGAYIGLEIAETTVGDTVVRSIQGFKLEQMGPKSMFLAIISGIGASSLYIRFDKFMRRRRHTLFSQGADREFNRMLSTFVPIALTTLIFAVVNVVVMYVFDVESFRELLIEAFNRLFSIGTNAFVKGFFFVLLSSVLWFFGIHGSDTLQNVMDKYFPTVQEIAEGVTPMSSMLPKEFFDCFVLMGGCGSTICLLIAILIFSRNRSRRSLGFTAAFPMIFNINEMMVFGLPIIFNPIMLVPFLAVPLVCYSVAYVFMAAGIVPVIAHSVEWTTPIILGGYTTTGSFLGALLQVVNVIIGVLIYMPFVRLLDRKTNDDAKSVYASFVDFFKANEQNLSSVKLTEMTDAHGDFAKNLCADLTHDIENGQVVLAYQPQYSYDGKCIGAEALLRWNHPLYGYIYPPLIIKLAEEAGILPALEEAVVLKALDDLTQARNLFGEDVKISINVTGTTVVTPRFLQFCRQLNAKEPFAGRKLCIEVTEQATLSFDEKTRLAFEELHNMGLMLAIDDFSMGQTSLNYLKDNMFDIIKLDGSLVKGLFTHQNCREIISSIAKLSSTLGLPVLAEYVETEEEREILHEIGVDYYQGYLYSPAVFLTEQDGKTDRA